MELFLYDSPAFKAFLKDHPHEAAEVRFLESVVEQGMNAIDVGASIGITTVVIAKKIGERGKLYSFEPFAEYFNILQKNLSSNKLENVKALQLAMSNQVGKTDFYEDGLSTSMVSKEGVRKFMVSTTTIDRYLNEEKVERIDLINMDCEGSELLVLKGAEETLRRNKVKIFCEIHHDFLRHLGQSVQDIVEYLEKLEFEVYSVSLDDLSMGSDFDKPEYIYAHN
ncbi:MAG: FkbM family methyltransferase [Chloroflexi bacterium]|jgi:FkbM family methyltransferase|nr:FkbM family methyltransferase [Chloroflexota bacterium]